MFVTFIQSASVTFPPGFFSALRIASSIIAVCSFGFEVALIISGAAGVAGAMGLGLSLGVTLLVEEDLRR